MKTIDTIYETYNVKSIYTNTKNTDEPCKQECMKCLNCEFGYIQYEIINGGIRE